MNVRTKDPFEELLHRYRGPVFQAPQIQRMFFFINSVAGEQVFNRMFRHLPSEEREVVVKRECLVGREFGIGLILRRRNSCRISRGNSGSLVHRRSCSRHQRKYIGAAQSGVIAAVLALETHGYEIDLYGHSRAESREQGQTLVPEEFKSHRFGVFAFAHNDESAFHFLGAVTERHLLLPEVTYPLTPFSNITSQNPSWNSPHHLKLPSNTSSPCSSTKL